jgi:oligopeptide/dipeptide ABC transporter ATP-binding protein
VARAIVGLAPVSEGSILIDGEDVAALGRRGFDRLRRRVQIVFQDPYSSLNPRMTVGEMLGEVLARHHGSRGPSRRAEIAELLDLVGLSEADAERYPGQFSGGQRQRIAISRALAVQPELVIADEVTSSLDVSIQASILNLLRKLQRTRRVSFLFISHNLGVVRWMSRRVAVMHLGQIVEEGLTADVFRSPRHPYTRALVDAIPRVGVLAAGRLPLEGDVPDPHHPPSGCRFHTRCPVGPVARPDRAICATEIPDPRILGNPNAAACFFPLDAGGGSHAAQAAANGSVHS